MMPVSLIPTPPDVPGSNTSATFSSASINASEHNYTSPISTTTKDNVEIIFQVVVVIIGIVGTGANGIVMSAFLSKKLRAQSINKLIINQLALDLFASLFAAVDYAAKIKEVYLEGGVGFFVCTVIYSNDIAFVGLTGSIAGLTMITLERYLKIVFPIQHRKYVKDWMIYSLIAISWINGVLMNIAVFWISPIVNGVCQSFTGWPSDSSSYIYSMFTFVWEFMIPLAIFVYCYGHILVVVRKSAKLFPGNETSAAAESASSHRSQMNIIKTMLTVTVAFIVCWSPNQVYFLLANINASGRKLISITVVMIFFNVCLNPFIYALKHEKIKQQLITWLQKLTNQQAGNVTQVQPATGQTGA